MAIVKPFAAVYYNPLKFSDLSKVVCPPYDVISRPRQLYYHDLEARNFIHILLGKDTPQEDKYERGGKTFLEWLAQGIFLQDIKPAIYFYSHQYKLKGETRTRLGFISLLHLGDKESSPLKHEHTHQQAKDDRYKLLKEVRANLSPIFVVFKDKLRVINYIYQKHIRQAAAFIEVTDDEKNTHKIWRIDDEAALRQIQQKMRDEHIFIADGHHRFEVACAWRDQMLASLPQPTGQESFNYIMSYFTNTDPRGLLILPIHRLLSFPAGLTTAQFLEDARTYFDAEELKDKARLFFLMEKNGGREHIFGMYKEKKYWLLRLKNVSILNTLLNDKPSEYRTLDVSILNRVVFEKLLKVTPEKEGCLKFSAQAEDLIKEADNDSSCAVFFLKPVMMEQIMSVALAGQRMPPKSTYFYPKVLSGLLINKLE